MNLDPITRIILQGESNTYYSLAWNASAGITIAPGAGVGTAVHGGNTYSFKAADPTGMTPPPDLSVDAAYNPAV